jgi:hypothetical protein
MPFPRNALSAHLDKDTEAVQMDSMRLKGGWKQGWRYHRMPSAACDSDFPRGFTSAAAAAGRRCPPTTAPALVCCSQASISCRPTHWLTAAGRHG